MAKMVCYFLNSFPPSLASFHEQRGKASPLRCFKSPIRQCSQKNLQHIDIQEKNEGEHAKHNLLASVNNKMILRNTDSAVKQGLSIFEVNVSASTVCSGQLRMGKYESYGLIAAHSGQSPKTAARSRSLEVPRSCCDIQGDSSGHEIASQQDCHN